MLERKKKQGPGGPGNNDDETEFIDFSDQIPDTKGTLELIDRILADNGLEEAKKDRQARREARRDSDEHRFCCGFRG